MRAVDFIPSYLRRALGWLAGSEDAEEAVQRLEHEPIFCVETGEKWTGANLVSCLASA